MGDPVSESKWKATRGALLDAALAVVLVYLYFWGSTQYSLFDTRLLVISGVVIAALVAAWALAGRHLPAREVMLPLLVFLAAQGLAAALSIDARRSLVEVWLYVVEASLFLLFSGLARGLFTPGRIVRLVLAVGAVFMTLSWSEAAQWYLKWIQAHPGEWLPAESYRLPAPNFVCVILNVWLMFALARLWWAKSSLERATLGLFALSALGLIYLTSSRGGWIGTAAGLGGLFLASLTLAPDFWKVRWQQVRGSRWGLAAVIGGALALAGGFVALLLLQELRPGHSPFLQARGYLWQPAWNAFLRSPLWGSGPFTFISFYLQVNSVPPSLFFDYAHNIYLDLLGGSGLLGLASFGWLAWELIRRLLKGLKGAQGTERAVLTGALAACAAFLAHGLFDSVHHTVPTSAWNLAILLGAASTAGVEDDTRRGWHSAAAAALGLLAAAGFFVNAWLGLPMEHGVRSAEQGDWPEAARQFELAVERDPRLAVTHQQLGLAYSKLYLLGETRALEKAESAFEQAAALDPHWLLNWINLGLVREARGDTAGALLAFQQAVASAPQAYESHWLLGRALETSGEEQQARLHYQSALETCPKCACAPFWAETDLRKDLSASVDCSEVLPGAAWNPGYVAFMFRRPSLNMDWVLVGE